LGFIEPGIADSIASPAARSLIETRRNLVRAVSNPGAGRSPPGGERRPARRWGHRKRVLPRAA
jgi:hypothetical protein